jgi:hypothetical protein
MSESEKRTPISVYLTPKAALILRDYNMGSGYGSLSRTVEEIILAFDSTYKTVKDTFKNIHNSLVGKTTLSDAEKISFFMVLITSLQNIDNTISRLQPTIENV